MLISLKSLFRNKGYQTLMLLVSSANGLRRSIMYRAAYIPMCS